MDHLLTLATTAAEKEPTERSSCAECNAPLRWSATCFLACTNAHCAQVFKDTLDFSPEWRHFPDDPSSVDMSRCGLPTNPLLVQSSYSCRVVGRPRRCSRSFRSIIKYTEWQAVPNREKVLATDFRHITSCAENHNLPKKLIDDAHFFYKQITDDSKKFRGVRREAILAAAVYISCKVNESVRTAVEISEMFQIGLKSAVLGCKTAHAIMSQQDISQQDEYIAKTTPDMIIERFCGRFSFSAELVKLATFVAKKVEQLHLLATNSPAAISAGIIYFVAQKCGMRQVTKRQVKMVCNMSEVTVSACYRVLSANVDLLVPPAVVAKYAIAAEDAPLPRKRAKLTHAVMDSCTAGGDEMPSSNK
jgi:transcription initiation factor TFIIB